MGMSSHSRRTGPAMRLAAMYPAPRPDDPVVPQEPTDDEPVDETPDEDEWVPL